MFLRNKSISISLLLVVTQLFLSCKEEEVTPSPQVLEINDFIWENMDEVYLWNDLLPQNINKSQEFDPEQYFNKLLFKPTDRWSFITDDYQELVNSLNGIEKSFGHSFKLFLLPGSTNVIGIVKKVVPGSPADLADIKRGDVFYKLNGQELNTSNYSDLLFTNESYNLSFGVFGSDGQIIFEEDKLLSSVIIEENPIYIHKTIDFEHTKIGYVSYNQFISSYADSLINVFEQFQVDGISDLVLDLRYNPGGSINTALLLSSMIAPASVIQNKEVFSRLVWNDNITQEILAEEGEESDNFITKFIEPPVNLDLSRVYILITSNSASASELVINCLAPYMDVILIGPENTTGKYVGSFTIHDDKSNWALQPIVLKTSNAIGVTDYANGFSPDYYVEDDFGAELGSLEEDMLAKSIELITGLSPSNPARIAAKLIPKNMLTIPDPEDEKKQGMYLDEAMN